LAPNLSKYLPTGASINGRSALAVGEGSGAWQSAEEMRIVVSNLPLDCLDEIIMKSNFDFR
jgi:hypothetical protein